MATPRSTARATGTSYDQLVQLACTLPLVEATTSYGTPSLKVKGKLMARLLEDGATVVLKTTWNDRERLLAIHPEVFFLTEHYRPHPTVLAHLAGLDEPLLAQVVNAAWRVVAPKSLLKA